MALRLCIRPPLTSGGYFGRPHGVAPTLGGEFVDFKGQLGETVFLIFIVTFRFNIYDWHKINHGFIFCKTFNIFMIKFNL